MTATTKLDGRGVAYVVCPLCAFQSQPQRLGPGEMRTLAVSLAYPAWLLRIPVLGCNLLGDGLRDLLDPQART